MQYGLGSSYPKDFQLQLSGTGTANMVLNPGNLVVNADTNGSFIGGGLFDQVLLNWNSKSAASLSNANNVRHAFDATSKLPLLQKLHHFHPCLDVLHSSTNLLRDLLEAPSSMTAIVPIRCPPELPQDRLHVTLALVGSA